VEALAVVHSQAAQLDELQLGLDVLGQDRGAALAPNSISAAASERRRGSSSSERVSDPSSLISSASSSRMWRRLEKPAPASSTARRAPSARTRAIATRKRR
jgi:hypothetical protein